MIRFASAASPRCIRACLFIAAAGFLLALAAGMLLPVYTDETGWRFQERAAIDGFDILFNDLCGPNTIARPPWLIMPVRWFSATTNLAFASPLFVRLEGVACALAWAGLLWLLIRQLEEDRARRWLLGTIAYGLLSLGTLPLLLVMSRPEQPLVLTTTLIVIVALYPASSAFSPRIATIFKVCAILLLSVIAQSYHMKGVLYAGVAFVAIGVCARGAGTVAPRLLGMASLIGAALATGHYWVERLRCDDNAVLRAMYARENAAFALTGDKGFGEITSTLLLGMNPMNYVVLTKATYTPMSLWIPGGLFSPQTQIVVSLALTVFWGFAIVSTACLLAKRLAQLGLAAFREPRFLLAGALVGCVLIWGASQLNRNVYEAAHVLPILILAILCTLAVSGEAARSIAKGWTFGAPVLTLFAVLSLSLIYGALAGPLLRAAGKPGFVAGQPLSVSIGDYDRIGRDVHDAMAAAGMPADRPLRRPLVDELTYLALQDSSLPLHRLGVLWIWNGDITDPASYLLSRRSDGIVVACSSLPPALRAVASKSGDICAVSAGTLRGMSPGA